MRRFLLFLVVAAFFSFALLACGGDDEEEGAQPAAVPPSADGGGDAAAGRDVFATAGCGSCHTLGAAGSSGQVGPNLDDLRPDFDEVVTQVTSGGGGMPAFGDELSDKEIRDVSSFVSESTSGDGGDDSDGSGGG
jgi:mono/diheme cytochrome c family protein